MADVKLTHVPYRGQPDALNDLMAGRISMMALTATLAEPLIKAGKLRAIGVTPDSRIAAHPEIPTVAESAGLPGYDVRPYTAVFVPAGTPDPIVQKLAADIAEIIAMPQIRAKLTAAGMEIRPVPTQALDAFIAKESARWENLLRRAGIVAK